VGEAAQNRTPDTQLFQNAFNASRIGIAVEALGGQPLFVNPALADLDQQDRAPGTAPTETVPVVWDVA
jgi:PAS domain-containing protein